MANPICTGQRWVENDCECQAWERAGRFCRGAIEALAWRAADRVRVTAVRRVPYELMEPARDLLSSDRAAARGKDRPSDG